MLIKLWLHPPMTPGMVQEYLAVGEVPETVRNAFMQKSRWCKGGMQVMLTERELMKHVMRWASR
jgi:cellulose synthase/poly-beta-1,6-N-acetylglucosamine synthase-like glycosyltransferase